MSVQRFDQIIGLFALLVLAASSAFAQQTGGWVGKRVITKFGTVLKVGRVVVDDEKRQASAHWGERANFRVYRVEKVNGPWLWLVAEKEGVSGWVKAEQVILYDQAIDYFTSELRTNPISEVYVQRGNIWLEKGEYDIAIADYNEAIRLKPNREVAWLNRGNAWVDKKEYDKAIADYNEAARLAPKFAAAYNNRGRAWDFKKEYDKGIADYNEAIRLDPKHVSAHLSRGRAWRAKKEHDKGIADYNEVIRLDPKFVAAYYNRGNAWRLKKEFDKAIADYNEAIRLDPKKPYHYECRAWLWATASNAKARDGRMAVDSAAFACELTEWKDSNSLDALAAAFAEMGKFDQAVGWQEKAIELAGKDSPDLKGYRDRLELYRAKKPYHQGEEAP